MGFIVKNTTFPSVFELIAPHSCRGCGRIGEAICGCCKNYITANKMCICPACKKPTRGGNCNDCESLPSVFIVGWRDELIGELVHDFKYNSKRALARPLAELLEARLPKIDDVIVVPLPTIGRHIRERGFDHTRLIAKNLVKLRPGWKIQKILVRQKNTVQVGADRDARLTQAEAAYAVSGEVSSGAKYLLIDDVWTTGASMKAAVKKLQEAGARKIIVGLLALSRFDEG